MSPYGGRSCCRNPGLKGTFSSSQKGDILMESRQAVSGTLTRRFAPAILLTLGAGFISDGGKRIVRSSFADSRRAIPGAALGEWRSVVLRRRRSVRATLSGRPVARTFSAAPRRRRHGQPEDAGKLSTRHRDVAFFGSRVERRESRAGEGS